MSEAVLEELRDVVVDNRRDGEVMPREKRRKVFVEPAGRIVIGDKLPRGDEGQSLSEVHQAVFAAPALIVIVLRRGAPRDRGGDRGAPARARRRAARAARGAPLVTDLVPDSARREHRREYRPSRALDAA